MTKPVCLTTAAPFVGTGPDDRPRIDGIDLRVLRNLEPGAPWPEEDAESVEAMFCSQPPPNFEAFPNVRWIQIESAGYSHLFPFRLHERDVVVTNIRGVFDCPIAEWNVAMMVNLTRDLRTMIRNQDAGVWDRSALFCGQLRGSTLGIWGYGGIGRETARLAKMMGMRVHVLARNPGSPRNDSTCIDGTGDPDGTIPDHYFTERERDEFLSNLDFLILALPLTAKTDGLLGEHELRTLPKGAFLLNPARGALVQEQALLDVLSDGHLGGVAIDTHYQYPLPPEHQLWSFPHVILTPHISGTTFSPSFTSGLLWVFRENAARFAAGQQLLNVVPPADLEG